MEPDAELFEAHARQPARMIPRLKTVVAIDGKQSGGRVIVNVFNPCRPRGSPRCDRLQRHEMGVRGMTKAAATDLALRKIRVHSVLPGPD